MKTTREKRLDNIYSSNINEGFYTNAGGNFEVELVKKLLNKSGECFNAEKSNTSSGVGKFAADNVLSIRSFSYNEWVQKFFSEFQPSDFKNGFPQGFAKYYFDNVILFFSPDTIKDEREIPKYFSIKNWKQTNLSGPMVIIKDLKNLESLDNFFSTTSLTALYIENCPKLKSLGKEVPVRITGGLSIIDCPNLEISDLPRFVQRNMVILNCPKLDIMKLKHRIDVGNKLEFFPDPGKQLLLRDFLPKFNAKGDIKYNKKLLTYDKPKPQPAVRSISANGSVQTKATTTDDTKSSNLPDVDYSRKTGKSILRRKDILNAINSSDEPQEWVMYASNNVVVDKNGDIIGFSSKKFKSVYQKGIRLFPIRISVGGGLTCYDENGKVVARITLDDSM